jgi:hypothetical protein
MAKTGHWSRYGSKQRAFIMGVPSYALSIMTKMYQKYGDNPNRESLSLVSEEGVFSEEALDIVETTGKSFSKRMEDAVKKLLPPGWKVFFDYDYTAWRCDIYKEE